MSFWPQGPREWSPRLLRGLRMLRELHDAIPRSMIVLDDGVWKVGDTRPYVRLGGNLDMKLAFMVKVRNLPSRVWIAASGEIMVDPAIRSLLRGEEAGFEHLACEWPKSENLQEK